MMNNKDVSRRQLFRFRNARLAWVLLLVGLVVTAGLWHFTTRLVTDRTRASFETQSLQLKTAVEQRLLNYEQVLAGSAALFALAEYVSREDWRLYVGRVDIDRYYPGIQGIGYIPRVTAAGISAHVEKLRAEGLKDYLVSPLGERSEYFPVTFLEPATQRNQRAFGFDAFGDAVHRLAMERARDTGNPAMTGKVVLVQENVDDEQAGFLMYLPVYQGSQISGDLTERRNSLEGFVFSAFRMNNLVDGIVGLIAPFLDVRIYDGVEVERSGLMYGSNLGSLDDQYTFEMSQELQHGGRSWLLQTRSTPAFDYLASDSRPLIVMVAGLVVSFLLFAFALSLIRARLLAQASEGRYRAITEGASNLTLVLGRDGAPVYASPSSEPILGFSPDRLQELDLESMVHGDDWPQLQASFEQALESPGRRLPVIHARVRDLGGEWRDMEGSLAAMLDEPGVHGVVLSLRDLTELKAAQAQLHRLAFYDPLTGLANRQLFRDRLAHTVRRSRRTGEAAALMFLDLDGFKRINDTLGHDAGDTLLQHISRWLTGCVREEDSVARFGGDEFVVLLSSVAGPEAVAGVAETILRRLRHRIRLNEHDVGVTVSIGIAMVPTDSEDPGVLMKYADLAMYQAKERGRNNFQFFTPVMNIQAAKRLLQHEELAEAMEAGRFVLHYQPKFDIREDRVVGVEAFLRWQHPVKGLVPAQQFIALAEESGLIVGLGEMALRQACIQIQALERAGFEALRVAVNFSIRQLIDPLFLDMFRRVITETGVAPDRLEVEMPAALLSRDPQMLQEVLGALHDLGVWLVVDDFGSGACSMVALQQLPLDAVKIDHCFIRDIPYNSSATDVASAVIALAHKLHLTVIAEGVETTHQLNFLRAAGCSQFQGNLFSYPLDEDALIGFLVRQYERALIS
ncbi:EAL domain-containing protein [Marinobacter sp.]|uniref:bifunctional diguanylate cyclase/phosphodiesterase n=1 Tax=Marinobacter sp. TaxID=50741 RepID=UPI0038509A88